ncbi:MAG TPA: uracil-DNA glycosylase [Verrucomicrobiae bacterium]|jgi:hypothetical protein|nr:uracil-DNA glycosylase [Verrucomicrobiae bacterium]
MTDMDAFMAQVKAFKSPGVFNPWRDVDRENDRGPSGPKIRAEQLEHYLAARRDKARICLLGEAVGYQGGHFSGIAMMSERILLGHCREKGLRPEDVLPDLEPRRTSKPAIMEKGFAEPTATMVWGLMKASGHPPLEFVTWNSFAWHPYHPARGPLTNRRPTPKESQAGLGVLRLFLKLFPRARIIALGRVAEACLADLGIAAEGVRHPAQGGSVKFRSQMARILEDEKARA